MAMDPTRPSDLLSAREHGQITKRTFATRLARCIPEIERACPGIFLMHLQEQVGVDKFANLLGKVTAEGEELSASLKVRRLIAREFAFLQGLSNYFQTARWHHTVGPLLELGASPAEMSVAEYQRMHEWKATPFVRLPRPSYDGASGYASIFLISALHLAANAAAHALQED